MKQMKDTRLAVFGLVLVHVRLVLGFAIPAKEKDHIVCDVKCGQNWRKHLK